MPGARFFSHLNALAIAIAAAPAFAADAFSPPAPASAQTTSAEQDARIAKLEEAPKKAIEKIDKGENPTDLKKDDESKLSAPSPMPMPSPLVKVGPGGGGKGDLSIDIGMAVSPERILGVINGAEIYVTEGVVRQRAAPSPVKTTKQTVR